MIKILIESIVITTIIIVVLVYFIRFLIRYEWLNNLQAGTEVTIKGFYFDSEFDIREIYIPAHIIEVKSNGIYRVEYDEEYLKELESWFPNINLIHPPLVDKTYIKPPMDIEKIDAINTKWLF